MSSCCHSFTRVHVADIMEDEAPWHCDVVSMETHLEIEEMKQALTVEINTMKESIVFIHDEMMERPHFYNCWWKWVVVVMVTMVVTRNGSPVVVSSRHFVIIMLVDGSFWWLV
ncbi:hypothetical protein L1887_05988 [Cichorium endivia]|nr:hypothetical protein L1887_05988 [Cichorium endivia]